MCPGERVRPTARGRSRGRSWATGEVVTTGFGEREPVRRQRVTAIACAVRCAPPDNKPSTEERNTCAPFLTHEFSLASKTTCAYLALGSFAWQATISSLRGLGHEISTTKFSHGAKVTFTDHNRKITIIGSYHPSQQNTFTGKLTKPMLDKVIKQAAKAAGII